MSTANSTEQKKGSKPIRKLVLCFDGTGNTFTGSSGDTNIVKLYDKLDRNDPDQYHYYQTGIGTYDTNGGSVNKGFLGSIRSMVARTLDSGFGTSFDHHVMAGYKFLMNHYNAGRKRRKAKWEEKISDRIYMFGFSRGAFTARFLARMIHTVGLLSMGNDEMVPFAYQLYQRYETGSGDKEARDDIRNEITAFKQTFGREVKVYFLGIFDCVNSVSVLGSPKEPVTVLGTATHVRHAVAVDEFRVKFKPALLHQDANRAEDETIKEVWFPGNHGDVGGGWPILDPPKTYREVLSRFFFGDPQKIGTSAVPSNDRFQMSDIPLDWMLRELELVNAEHPDWAISFSSRKTKYQLGLQNKLQQAKEGMMHDTMKFGGGSGFFKVIMWNFMEYLPLISRYELTKEGEWEKRMFTPNMGYARDIPAGGLLHQALVDRIKHSDLCYRPSNNHGDGTNPCLLNRDGSGAVEELVTVLDQRNVDQLQQTQQELDLQQKRDELHTVYTFDQVALKSSPSL